jgi:hypothetical protein
MLSQAADNIVSFSGRPKAPTKKIVREERMRLHDFSSADIDSMSAGLPILADRPHLAGCDFINSAP